MAALYRQPGARSSMKESSTLADLLQEHFDGVLRTIQCGRWGSWVLDRELAAGGRLVLTHEGAAFAVSVGMPTDWVALVAGKDWASATDVGQLIFAIRDLEYARWLGILPGAMAEPGLSAE
jgi:hypothetical protein